MQVLNSYSLQDFSSEAMALWLALIFVCAGLTGIQSFSTIKHVAVEAGDTVHIPCKYEDKYRDNVKYLCSGYSWDLCTTKIRSDKENSSKYSVNDDKTWRIVTFTFKNLESKDSGSYWCIVEKPGTDDGQRFRLSVKNSKPKLHVDSQWTDGYFSQVTVVCQCGGSESKQWCRVGGACVSTSGQIDGASVSINTSVPGKFAVTMTGLSEQNIGWYWCSFGDLQIPVFLHLMERPSPIESLTTLSTAKPTATFSTNESGKKRMTDYILAAVALGLLICIVLVAVIVWFMLKRKKTTNNMETMEGTQMEKDEAVLYSDINCSQQSSNQEKNKAPEVSVIYSTLQRQSTSLMTGPAEGSVVYSTVSKKK